MPIKLNNDRLSLRFHLPHEGYMGTRFSAIGKLVEVKFEGILCTANELKTGFSEQHGAGFYNEYDIDTALGFEEVDKGDWFHKIGVGLLKKDTDSYDFFKSYEVIPAEFSVETSGKDASFKTIQEEHHGYAYELIQTYVLEENGFSIKYSLKNWGSKSIKTTEYNHNFLQLNERALGREYQVIFNPEVQFFRESEFVNPNKSVDFNSERLTFNSTPKSDFFISNLLSKTAQDLSWELQLGTTVSIQSTTDVSPCKMNIWGVGHVISPELFVNIAVEPGETETWSRNYRFKRL